MRPQNPVLRAVVTFAVVLVAFVASVVIACTVATVLLALLNW